jgi:hypothetical protein
MGTQLEKFVIEARTMSAVDRAVSARMLLESLPTDHCSADLGCVRGATGVGRLRFASVKGGR